MRATLVMVLEVGTLQSNEMAFPEDHDMREELAPAAANPAFELVRVNRPTRHVTRHRDLGDFESELQQLAVDARFTPSILCHQANETLNLRIDSRSPWATVSLRYLRPVVPKTLMGPLRDRVRVNDDQATRPPGPERPQCNPEGAVNIVERRTWPLELERAYLLTEGQILGQELRTGEKQGPGHPCTRGIRGRVLTEAYYPVCRQIHLKSSPMRRRPHLNPGRR